MDTDMGFNTKELSENRLKISEVFRKDIVFNEYRLSNISNIEVSRDMFQYQILKDDKQIGLVDLQTFPLDLQSSVSDISIKDQGQGNGLVIYDRLGEYLTSNGLEFRSSGTQNNGALKIWERFYNEGKAILIKDNTDPTRRVYKFVGNR